MKTRGWTLMLVAIVVIGALMAPIAEAKKGKRASQRENSPLVIGHRGASGFLPEHTIQAYRLAIKLGADYIEPDVVATKDGVLIARHEPMLGSTAAGGDSTDVEDHPEFADRETTKDVDGIPTQGFFADDFTLAEIKTLRARQTRGGRPTRFNDRFKIPTLQEVIDLAKRESRKRDRTIGIYPETKHPTFHKDENLPLERRLVRILKRNGLNHRRAPVFIQSFEQANLKRLNRMTPVRLVQLMDAADTDPVTGNPVFSPPWDRPVRLDGVRPHGHLRLLRDERRPQRGEAVRGRNRAVEGLHHPHDRGWGRRRAAAHGPDPARARARAPGPHVDVPRRRVPDRVSGRAGR